MKALQNGVYTECHINISVIPYLEKHMGFCAKMYEEDTEICRNTLRRAAQKAPWEEQTLFWICRSDGSYCAAEQDVFIRDTTANHHSMTETDPRATDVHAFIVEVTGVAGNEVMGNVYKLNREAYAFDVRRLSQPALRAQNMPPRTLALACHAFPVDPTYLETILEYQRQCRAAMAKAG